LVPYGFYQRTSAKISGQYFFTQKNGTAEAMPFLISLRFLCARCVLRGE
jgi:hypothetical protein